MLARDRVSVRRVSRDPALREVHPRERNRSRPLKILISAAETSSDAHGAALLRALKELSGNEAVEAFGIGGPKLQGEGLRAIVDARELLSMGFSEILGRLPRILRALRQVSEESRREKPQIAVVIDYPDFHFKLARRLKSQGVPVVYYIPPKVWAWRKGRIRVLRENFAQVLSILPFEEEFYRREGMPVKYVGNPLADELPLSLGREQARAQLGIHASDPTVILMPGSRPSELKRHVAPMLEAAVVTAKRIGKPLQVLVPFPVTADMAAMTETLRHWSNLPEIRLRISQGDAPVCQVAADAGLIKSGTSTLEAGILGLPHAVVYRPSRLTTWIFRYLIRYRGPVGLVNLVAGYEKGKPYLAREILNEEVTVPVLADELHRLMTQDQARAQMKSGLAQLRETVLGGSSLGPSRTAAQEILRIASSMARVNRT